MRAIGPAPPQSVVRAQAVLDAAGAMTYRGPMIRPWLVVTALLVACSSDPTVPIGSPDAASSTDAATDAAAADASASRDAEPVDARPLADAGDLDAMPDDAASIDSAVADAAAVDAAVALDAGDLDASATDGAAPADASTASDAGATACLVDGIYGTNFSGMVVYFSFDLATGRWGASETRADLPANPVLAGSFTFSAGVLGLEEDPGKGCPPGVATYTTVFNAACMQFRLEVIADPCTERAMALDRAVFTL